MIFSNNPSIAIAALTLISCTTASAVNAQNSEKKPRADNVKLEGMPYIDGRKVIQQYGWKPVLGNCDSYYKDVCAARPELETCSGTGLGYCSMVFYKNNRCLTVVTTGGPPAKDKSPTLRGDPATIDNVRFSRGPCKKD